MKISLRIVCALIALAGSGAGAQSPVDTSSKLETISTEFGMCDGPAWGGGSLWVPDVKGGKLYRYWPTPKKLTVALADAGRISAADYNLGRLYLADNGNARIAWLKDGKKTPLGQFTEAGVKENKLRPNDLVVDSRGGVYFTLTGLGKVIYLPGNDPSQPQVAISEIDTPNGVALSPDEQTLYVASYAPKKIWAFPVTAPGQTGERRLLASMDDGPDKGADGMTIDRAGNVYCAGPAHIWIWNPSGKLLTKLETPTRPINCAFGDGDMHSLYITALGGLYRQRMNVTGIPSEPSMDPAEAVPGDKNLSTALPPGVKAELNVVYASYGDRKLLADVVMPRPSKSIRPAIVVVHGGGWLNGDKSRFRALALGLAARGYVTAAIEYRLAGEAKFPAAIQDCNAAVRFLRANAARYQLDPDRIGAVGGSAGGHLVGLMAAAPDVREFQGSGGNPDQSSRLQAAVVMAGPMELATGPIAERSHKGAGRTFTIDFLGTTIDDDRSLYEQASPITHFSKSTPPVLFMTGELDKPERDTQAIKRLKELGVWSEQKVYKDGKHGCWMRNPWYDQMLADMDAFFQAHLH
ncbi:MAG TPA: SMP-30/gluconolactonase/LRE family protein [Pirellulales bacterium]